MNPSIMDMLSQEADSYQSYLDRGKAAMDNYDLQKVTHDGLDEAYKQGKNLASSIAREALGERTLGYVESGIGAAPMVGRAYSAIGAGIKARNARLTYENMTGKSLKQGVQDKQMQSRLQERQARQQAQREGRQEQPQEEEEDEDPEMTDLRARLDRLRTEDGPEAQPDEGARGDTGGDVEPTIETDEYGLPRLPGIDAPAEDAPAATEAGFPRPPAEEEGYDLRIPAEEGFPHTGADPTEGAGDVLQRADDVFARMDRVLARGRQTLGQASRVAEPAEVPTETERLQGRPGDYRAADEGFGQGEVDRGGTYSIRGGVRELDRGALRARRQAQPEFEEDFGQRPQIQTRSIRTGADQYGDRPTEGGMEQSMAEREQRFAQMDADAADQAARDAADRAHPPTRGTECGEGIQEGPTELPGQQQQEFDDDYMPEDEETRLARLRESRAPLESQGVEQPTGPLPGESEQQTADRLGTFDAEARQAGAEAPRQPDLPARPQPGADDAPKPPPEATDPAPALEAGEGAEAAEDAALAEGVATAEAAESALPGIGEGLMALTAIGGAIYGAIEGSKHHEAAPPPPAPLPKPPVIPNTAFASAPLIDSNQFHSL